MPWTSCVTGIQTEYSSEVRENGVGGIGKRNDKPCIKIFVRVQKTRNSTSRSLKTSHVVLSRLEPLVFRKQLTDCKLTDQTVQCYYLSFITVKELLPILLNVIKYTYFKKLNNFILIVDFPRLHTKQIIYTSYFYETW